MWPDLAKRLSVGAPVKNGKPDVGWMLAKLRAQLERGASNARYFREFVIDTMRPEGVDRDAVERELAARKSTAAPKLLPRYWLSLGKDGMRLEGRAEGLIGTETIERSES